MVRATLGIVRLYQGVRGYIRGVRVNEPRYDYMGYLYLPVGAMVRGRYRVRRLLSKSDLGTVYWAEFTPPGANVARGAVLKLSRL